MLNNVPKQVSSSARLVTLRHPNSMDCTIYRKTVNRVATDLVNPALGGLPTIDGLGVLDSDDEADYDYDDIGDAKILFAWVFQTQGNNVTDDGNDLLYRDPIPVEAMIECVLNPADVNFVVPQKSDIISVMPGAGLVLSYEVLGETGSISIPPYTRKYLLSSRQDQNVGI